MACFVGLAVVGSLVEQIPNFEILTMTVFLSGVMLGPAPGAIIGILSAFLFSTFSPYGQAPPPLLIAQMLAIGLDGLAGGLIRFDKSSSSRTRALYGACGFGLTLLYDVLTTMSFTVAVDLDLAKFFATFALGSWFTLLHVASNTLIFALILPILVQRLSTLPVFHSRSTAKKNLAES
jgi:hypothetical protein